MKTEIKLGAFIAAGIALTIAGGWYMRSQPGKISSTATTNKPLRISSDTTFETLDSTRYSTLTAASTIGNLFDGLYGHNAKGNIIADVSDGAPQISKDKRTYTFHLRHYQWSNGTPLTADDFVYAWQRLANPAVESRNASRIDILKNGEAVRMGTKPLSALGVAATSKYTLKVELASPDPYLFEALSSAPFMPISRKYALAQGKLYGSDANHILTNGPFTIQKWTGNNDKHWQLVKNKRYYFKRNVQLSQIDFSVDGNSSNAATRFTQQKLDYTAIDADSVPKYLGNRKLHRMTTTSCAYLIFNTTAGPTKNVHLRHAIATAFDKHLFAAGTLQNGAKALNGIVPTNLARSSTGADFRATGGSLLEFDTAYALKQWHLAQRELGTSHMTVTLNIANTSDAKLAGNFLKGQIEHNLPGLKIALQATDLEKRVALETAGNYQMVFSTWTPADVDPYNLLSFYLTDSRLNISGYSNAKYDQMLRAINQLGDQPQKRWRQELAAEKYLLTVDAPMAGVYQAGLAYLLTDRVETFPVLPNGIINYEYVRLH
ncbi:peptide ABC transporter substrate-binding protein [Lacticaseibacillus sharpeae]|uniref:Putative pheromone binding protein n=1 Tax=Lacticaseibacillus sharpeae JCM 1186 = DSM 20505 TaxID=1291052 RepID=A0A0R1ZJ54_9LACO|nr:peptide ABC transporter substrate-binding protein [Lacticaseibacillus sharpeae]KRM54893.1 putative pheromone binding protein [Lacticaseibacillus sharpeae JCM 1186 = DSM 20505]